MANHKITKKSGRQPVDYSWLDEEIADEFLNEFGVDLDPDLSEFSDDSYADELCKGIAGYNFGKFNNNW